MPPPKNQAHTHHLPVEPCHAPHIYGHDSALAEIIAAYQSQRLHHAWLITGKQGIGKATLAWHFAQYVLSSGTNGPQNIDFTQAVARLAASGGHPDLFLLSRDVDEKTGDVKDIISIDQARKLAPFMHLTASYMGWRIAIIDEAHALNRNAQNALLKLIEEPPQKALIIMTATSSGLLLPTIRSRCRVLSLKPLDTPTLQKVLSLNGFDLGSGEDYKTILELAEGSAGLALRLASTDCIALLQDMEHLLINLPKLDMAKLHQFADKIGKKAEKEHFALISEILQEKLRKNALNSAKNGHPQLEKSLGLWEKASEIFRETEKANLDPKLSIINVFTEIRRRAV